MKLLLLGAMKMHQDICFRIKELGHELYTCDYFPDAPCHGIADKAFVISTTDLEAVLDVAKSIDIDGVMTYNSDPAALTAAFISSKLTLPGNRFESVKIMSEKDLFRTFLKANNFNTPNFKICSSESDLNTEIFDLSFPILVKPVDSSGSKGISVINNCNELHQAFVSALNNSRAKRIILEEYIEAKLCQLHGDAFVENGIIKFICLGDHHFDVSINNLVPFSTSFPSLHANEDLNRVKEEVQRYISAIGFKTGGVNIEARIDKVSNKVYLIEVGPRNGGNFTPKIIQLSTGFNFEDAAINSALGLPIIYPQSYSNDNSCYLVPHVNEDCTFKGIRFDDLILNNLVKFVSYKKEGDQLSPFNGANAAIGVCLMKFKSKADMDNVISNFKSYYTVYVE